MDGSFREVIVSDHIFLLTAIAVDPVLEEIYWCDSVLGVIESTDFSGFRRRKVVDHLQYPISITVFEDYIYWADRATNSLSRCDKFSGKDRETLLRETTPLYSLLILHNAAQMQGENRCSSNNCLHICLPTGTSFVCKCDDRNLTDTASCELHSSSVNQSCPEDYCPEKTLCAVDGDRFVCKCPPHSAGERCEKNLQRTGNSSNEPHPVWIVCAVLVVVCVCLLATSVLIYRRYRKSTEMFVSKVQYVNYTSSVQESCGAAEKIGRRENEYEAVVIM
ncbi:Low-density lipoprotein receptor-related protein 4 [Araneus ventricosus]|uniref:Low-density lipoprotein receptor-related protein 4 n=1 Tax=Araneus ventricosus TaxID=182803 RepID=A0A4Y2JPQ0_ARAVE|nr:Low-density lipoprotein receptor-related protein 4 [Araneus ventricosus]